jgi:DNA repair exonuclease SbcCD nuclease subunit
VYWIRGNHDDPTASRKHKNYLGEYGYIPKHKLFYVAGAWSIDFAWRKEWNYKKQWEKEKYNSKTPAKKVWWEDEELSSIELEAAINLYAETKPEIMISHEAPSSIVPHVLSKVKLDMSTSPMVNIEWEKYRDESTCNRPEKLECIQTRTSQALQNLLDIHRPKYWCFGHYHISKIVDTGSTLFKCCAELEPFRIPNE